MKLKNMKLVNVEVPSQAMPMDYQAPKYPCGLSVSLDEQSIQKLGITKLPGVGEKMMLYARVEVCAVSEYETKDSSNRSISLQITDMDVEADKSKADVGEKLYGKGAE